MRIRRIFLLAAIFCITLSMPVHASESGIYEKTEADTLMDALPEETQDLLSASGISPEEFKTDQVSTLLQTLVDQIGGDLKSPFRTAVLLIVISVLSKAVLELASDELSRAVNFCTVLSAAMLLLPQCLSLIEQTASVVQALSGFLLAAVPVYAGILVLSGSAAVGSSYGALTLTAANGISALSGQVILPLTRIFLALSAVFSVVDCSLQKITDMVYRGVKWTLTLAVSVFTGVLSLQTLISGQTDAVSGKAAKLIASSAIPIVGGAFSDALSILKTSVGTVKSGIGAFGVLAAAAVFLPISLKIGAWILVGEISAVSSELFSLEGLSTFLRGCVSVLKMLLAVLFSIGIAAMISAAILLCVRGTYG